MQQSFALDQFIRSLFLVRHTGAVSKSPSQGSIDRDSERRHRALSYLGLLWLFLLGACSAPEHGVNDETRRLDATQSLTSAVYQINSGGAAVAPFAADGFVSAGNVFSQSVAVSTSGVANAAPASVYQSERYGDFSYNFTGLTPSASYTVRLHFAEIYHTVAGARIFNVTVNGTQVLSNFDIFATAGANTALVRDFSTVASSTGQIVIAYASVKDYAKSSAVEILSAESVGAPAANRPPTIATAAAATPSPVTGSTVSLSVLGADDRGEAGLTYRWATSGTAPAPVSFSTNNSNAAKNTVATFTQAGNYTFVVTVKDAGGATATSSVAVSVNQVVTSMTISPSSAAISVGSKQQFVATASDQFGTAIAGAAVQWAASGAGTVNSSGLFTAGTSSGVATVSASAGGKTASASITVSATSTATTVYQINAGGGAIGSFNADQYATGGSPFNTSNVVSTAGVANAAPAAAYQTERFGDFTYTFPSLTQSATYTVRLHFAEIFQTSAGARLFNVTINGTQVLSNFDIYAQAGMNKALVVAFPNVAPSTGQIAIRFDTVKDSAKVSAIEIISTGTSAGNSAPSVATQASANPNPVLGSTSTLSVLGADDGGEQTLVYNWSTIGSPPSPVSFSTNGNNAAKTTVATFGRAGTYSLLATIRDAQGASATSTVNVTVNATPTSVAVTPATAQVAAGSTAQFLATVKDQFGAALSPQPALTWAVSGGGTVSGTGLFSAGNTAGGPFTLTASASGKVGTASVTVTVAGGPVSYSTNFDLNEAPISEGGVWKHLGLDWTLVNTSGGNAYGTQAGTGAYDDSYAYLSGFPPDQTASAVVRMDPQFSRTSTREVELLLRWADSAHVARGYECNFAFDGAYVQIVRWNGALSDWTYLIGSGPGSVAGGMHDGDVVSAKIVGNVITVYVNGTQIYTAADTAGPGNGAVWTTGNPGIGFWKGSGASSFPGDYGFKSFSASGIGG